MKPIAARMAIALIQEKTFSGNYMWLIQALQAGALGKVIQIGCPL
jgi:hypothetical protein